jgi:hypothetical protein
MDVAYTICEPGTLTQMCVSAKYPIGNGTANYILYKSSCNGAGTYGPIEPTSLNTSIPVSSVLPPGNLGSCGFVTVTPTVDVSPNDLVAVRVTLLNPSEGPFLVSSAKTAATVLKFPLSL